MTTLTLDIKPNDALEKSALKTASALDKVAASEKQVDAVSKKIGASYAKVAAASSTIAKARTKAIATASKAYAVSKKDTDEDKKKYDWKKKALDLAKSTVTVLIAGATAAFGLGAALTAIGKNTFEARKQAGALLNAFTANRGDKAMRLIDGMAEKLGMSLAEARAKFVEFREAGLNNKMSAQLIKLRADMMAVGLSAEEADKRITLVTGAADGLGNVVAGQNMARLARAFQVTGDGAKAAAHAQISLEGAYNKVSNVATEALADFWKKVGPDIGRAAHELANFATAFLKSDEGKAGIKEVADAVRTLFKELAADKGNVKAIFETIRDSAVAATKAITALSKAIKFLSSEPNANEKALTGDAMREQFAKVKDFFGFGKSAADGVIQGIASKRSAVQQAAKDMADGTSKPFAEKLGIKSPSRVFAEYGRNTVEGFEQGEQRALGSRAMPLQEAAAMKPPELRAPSTTQNVTQAPSVVIQNLNVTGGNADEVGRSVRREIQLLLQAGQLSRGIA